MQASFVQQLSFDEQQEPVEQSSHDFVAQHDSVAAFGVAEFDVFEVGLTKEAKAIETVAIAASVENARVRMIVLLKEI